MRTLIPFFAGSLLVGLLAVAGCGSPRETVSVTERPDTPTEQTDTTEDTATSVFSVTSRFDTVQAGAFDRGKLWPIDELPADYFESRYGVTPGEEWRSKVMQGTLRFGEGCSGAFVSSDGLVMTNHHCAREHVTAASQEGERLLSEGFYANTPGEERRSADLYVEQLVEVEDVTSRIVNPSSRQVRRGSRQFRVNQLESKLTAAAKEEDERLRVEVVNMYQGAKYAAYTYRRYEDVRLVMVPEQDLGFFGGESDNFTYPRHTLDVAFFRVYHQGTPLESDQHFRWDPDGAQEGDPVFAVGNPGSTSRLKMVSQLKYKRDHELPSRLRVLRSRRDLFRSYITEHPEEAATYAVRNTFFSLQNSIKSLEGQLRGLQDPYLLARRKRGIQNLLDSTRAVDSLQASMRAIEELRQLQESKRILADKNEAFITFANPQLGSRILSRALHGYYLNFLRKRGAPPNLLRDLREDARRIEDWPDELEREVLAAQLEEIQSVYGADHPSLKRVFVGDTPDELASQLVNNSVLTNAAAFEKLLDEGYTQSDDPSVQVINAIGPLFLNVNRQMSDFRRSEEEVNRQLSRARRTLLGTPVPPDATFSLRVSDGVVRGYRHHGTPVPAFTSYNGLYDKYYSHGRSNWDLPQQWISPPDSFDVNTPLNLVSTNDIAGGSSGSPLLNRDLEVVGVVFDSNMEALPNTYLYRTRGPRAISVDVRGILEALEHIYEADRLVEELTTGRLLTAQSTPDPASN